MATAAIWCATLSAGLWVLGAVMQGRLGILQGLMVVSAALATATSALGLVGLHQLFKPLTLLIAILFIAIHAISTWANVHFDHKLRAGWLCGWADRWRATWPRPPGTTSLIAGLASFLVAHLFYIALFPPQHAGIRLVPQRRALLGTLLWVGPYVFVYPGLPGQVLKVAVAAYVVVISLMAAQAIGRAALLRILGVCRCGHWGLFLHAQRFAAGHNRFVQPLPLSGLGAVSR